MKPDSAIIYFTVSSGTGYGIIFSLLILLFNNNIEINTSIKLIVAFISLLLITSGLISSTIHLGHPERAWRALSQWRSSWLSREGVAAIITFFPISLFFIFWIFTNKINITLIFLIIAVIFSLITIYCTAKIYSSIKAIPAWHNPFVPLIYILNSLVLGTIISYSLLFNFGIKNIYLSNSLIIFSMTALFIKLLYWYSIKDKSKTNISTATGLGSVKKTSFFEGPHTGKNFLTSEMINKINKSKSILLRLTVCIFCYITPAYFTLEQNNLVMNNDIIGITLIIVTTFALIGMFIERYLFFIESKHTVSLYYGEKSI